MVASKSMDDEAARAEGAVGRGFSARAERAD